MNKYIVTALTVNNKLLYLCSRGDGYSYILRDTPLSAALWNSYEEALSIKNTTLGDSGSVKKVTNLEQDTNK